MRSNKARSVLLIPGGLGETQDSKAMAEKIMALINEGHRQGDGPVFLGGGGREMIADLDEGREAFDQLFVGDHAFLAARFPGQDLVGHGAPEELEKGLAVVEFGGGRDDAAVLAEIVGQKFRVRAAHSGGEDQRCHPY